MLAIGQAVGLRRMAFDLHHGAGVDHPGIDDEGFRVDHGHHRIQMHKSALRRQMHRHHPLKAQVHIEDLPRQILHGMDAGALGAADRHHLF
ncbi:hypothetical protein SDC9_198039 [bioreactor metagenome]|uniref:Uncharacterized protein n=1 Tax=bioreactor metagenome TaxID=1076179 RepID=A0A645ITD5_9ZZZZ